MKKGILIIFIIISTGLRAQTVVSIKPANVSTKLKTEFKGFYKGYTVKRYEKIMINGKVFYRLTVPRLNNPKKYFYPVFSCGIKNGKEYAHMINSGKMNYK